MSGAPLLEVRALVVDLPGPVRALDGVDLEIASGGRLAVVGPSGSGKTTLALAILGLLPPGAGTSGRILARDGDAAPEDLLALSEERRRRYRGRWAAMVFQEPGTSLHPAIRIGAQIAEAVRCHEGTGRREAERRAEASLARAGLPDPAAAARARVHELSGGMRQRALIAMAVACRPSLIIADEPTSALDAVHARAVLELLAGLCRDDGTALLLITHDLAAAAAAGGRIAVIGDGRVAETGDAAGVLARPAHELTRSLLAARPQLPVPARSGTPEEGT